MIGYLAMLLGAVLFVGGVVAATSGTLIGLVVGGPVAIVGAMFVAVEMAVW